MTTAQSEGTERLAQALTERLSLPAVVDLVPLAMRLGLRVQEEHADGFDGALVRALHQQKGIVVISSRIRDAARKRFTIAHEVGHFLIPHHRNLKNVCGAAEIETWGHGIAAAEREANSFAAALLLPRKHMLNRSDWRTCPTFKQIRSAATFFGTSLTATACRFVSFTDAPCCVVWSESRSSRWCFKSAALSLPLNLEELPGPQSWAARSFSGQMPPDEPCEVPIEAWVGRRDISRVQYVYEHSIFLRSYNAVLSLIEFTLGDGSLHSENDAFRVPLDPFRLDSRLRRR